MTKMKPESITKTERNESITAPIRVRYTKQPEHSTNKNEYYAMLPPGSSFNVYPDNPPTFREVVDGLFSSMVKLARIVESILNQCLGLPPNFFNEYNDDRNGDLLTLLHYFPATETSNTGAYEHLDVNIVTFVLQDDDGGLELYSTHRWEMAINKVPNPIEGGALVLNLGDDMQVLSNDKFKGPIHRVVAQSGKDCYSYAFSLMLGGDKWVVPLTQFTKETNEAPKYEGFEFGEYLQVRLKEVNDLPKFEDMTTINNYAIHAVTSTS